MGAAVAVLAAVAAAVAVVVSLHFAGVFVSPAQPTPAPTGILGMLPYDCATGQEIVGLFLPTYSATTACVREYEYSVFVNVTADSFTYYAIPGCTGTINNVVNYTACSGDPGAFYYALETVPGVVSKFRWVGSRTCTGNYFSVDYTYTPSACDAYGTRVVFNETSRMLELAYFPEADCTGTPDVESFPYLLASQDASNSSLCVDSSGPDAAESYVWQRLPLEP